MYNNNEVIAERLDEANAVRITGTDQNNTPITDNTLGSIMNEINCVTNDINSMLYKIGRNMIGKEADTPEEALGNPECFMDDLKAHLEYLYHIQSFISLIGVHIC